MDQLRIYLACSVNGYQCGFSNYYMLASHEGEVVQIFLSPHPRVKSFTSRTLLRFSFVTDQFRSSRIFIDNDVVYDFTLRVDDEVHKFDFWYEGELWRFEYDTKWFREKKEN